MKEIVSTANAPAAIGPYSQGVKNGAFLFVSGQLPVDPVSGEIAAGDIAAQTDQSLKNLQAIVNESGGELKDVVKTTVFLAQISDFAAMNEVYKRYFSSGCPARSAFQVAALPKAALVEIEAIAILP
ncbi:MAG: RidA family protein [Treponema sp.]|jgi:2-iminobutanoate/2-iminopropanoate deaminase|nr:RidA family protein [Treponema sp.]